MSQNEYEQFKFDTTYQSALRHRAHLRWQQGKDELLDFVIAPEIEAADDAVNGPGLQALANNVDKLFTMCELLGIDRIFIGSGELVGADGVEYDRFPAIWKLASVLDGSEYNDGVGYKAGCGNSDQYQVGNTDIFLADEYVDHAWCVKTRTKISSDPFVSNMVVTSQYCNARA